MKQVCVNCKKYRKVGNGVGRCLGVSEIIKDADDEKRYQFCKDTHTCKHFTKGEQE